MCGGNVGGGGGFVNDEYTKGLLCTGFGHKSIPLTHKEEAFWL